MTVYRFQHTASKPCATIPFKKKLQNILTFPTSTEDKIRKLQTKLAVEARILEENQFLPDELRLQYTKTQFSVYFEGLRSSLNSFINSSNVIAFKYVLLYMMHETKGEIDLRFERIATLYRTIATQPLTLSDTLLHDFLQARDLILSQTPGGYLNYKVQRMNEICSVLAGQKTEDRLIFKS